MSEKIKKRVIELARTSRFNKKRPACINADCIRAMTDEELVDLIIRYDSNLDCYFAPPNSQYHTDEESAKMDALKWLQQPTEEDKPNG